ncbi:MAG: hypothetical protein JW776_05165 [Candidatus Lokiarchaeota archaeon]|nr:hypothetical protein [Candidatus Lokiarchaeota archaeon]
MVNITLSLSKKMKEEMEKFPEINWSEVARSSIKKKLAQLKFMDAFLKESTFSVEDATKYGEELSRLVYEKYIKELE